jgi:hypothetical protein
MSERETWLMFAGAALTGLLAQHESVGIDNEEVGTRYNWIEAVQGASDVADLMMVEASKRGKL